MSVTLTDNERNSLRVNAWNWGVLHYTLVCSKPPLFDDEELLTLLRSGGAELAEVDVELVAYYLRQVVLPMIKPGERMFYDLTVTDEPDDGTFYRDDLERNYSLHHDVLMAVIEFLEQAIAPVHVL